MSNGWLGGRYPKERVIENLMRGVHKAVDGCWERTTGIARNGYSKVSFKRKLVGAHRMSYLLFKGEIGDKFVLHTCDNKRCINPDHLFLGTATDNSQDALSKTRNYVGNRNSRARLNDADVTCIRLMRAMGFGPTVLGELFGVCRVHVQHIIRRDAWKNLTYPAMAQQPALR